MQARLTGVKAATRCRPYRRGHDPPHHTRLTQMFGQRKQLRRLAAHLLLGWLFALTTGIVNACVVEPASRHSALPAALHVDPAAQAHHDEHVGAAVKHAHPSPHADTITCAKFCDETSTPAPTGGQPMQPLNAVGLALCSSPLAALATLE